MRAMLVAALVAVAAAVGCADDPDPTYLFQTEVGDTVFVDAWDEGKGAGDRALIELKPDEATWVIDPSVPYSDTKTRTYTVEVERRNNGFVVHDLNGTDVEWDHDGCLAPDDEEIVDMKDTSADAGPKPDADDIEYDDCKPEQDEDS